MTIHPNVITSIASRFKGSDTKAVVAAKRSGTFELILIGLRLIEINQEILNKLGRLEDVAKN